MQCCTQIKLDNLCGSNVHVWKKHVEIPQLPLTSENSNLLCANHLPANSQCLLQHSQIDLTNVPKIRLYTVETLSFLSFTFSFPLVSTFPLLDLPLLWVPLPFPFLSHFRPPFFESLWKDVYLRVPHCPWCFLPTQPHTEAFLHLHGSNSDTLSQCVRISRTCGSYLEMRQSPSASVHWWFSSRAQSIELPERASSSCRIWWHSAKGVPSCYPGPFQQWHNQFSKSHWLSRGSGLHRSWSFSQKWWWHQGGHLQTACAKSLPASQPNLLCWSARTWLTLARLQILHPLCWSGQFSALSLCRRESVRGGSRTQHYSAQHLPSHRVADPTLSKWLHLHVGLPPLGWLLALVHFETVLPRCETPETSHAIKCPRHWISLVGISPQTLQIRIVHCQLLLHLCPAGPNPTS